MMQKKLFKLLFLLIIGFYAPTVFGATISASAILPPFAQNLTGFWPLDGKTVDWNANKAADLSGRGLTATLNSMTPALNIVKGKTGQALLFDGSASYLSIASNPITSISTNNSICTWAYTGDVSVFPGAWNQTFLNFLNDLNNGVRMGSIVNSGVFFVSYKVGGTSFGAQTTATVFTNNTWNYVCFVRSGTGISLYANGISLATTTNTDSIGSVNTIGARDDQGDGNWFGGLDNVAVYNRALSASEIRLLYSQSSGGKIDITQTGPSTLNQGMVGWWTFDGKDTAWSSATSGTTIDKSGNGNVGTLTNMSEATSTVPGKMGQAFNFNGINAYINLTANSGIPIYSTTQPYAFSAWLKGSSCAAASQKIYTEGKSNGTGAFIITCGNATPTKLQIFIRNDANSTLLSVNSNTTVFDGQWHHIVWSDNAGSASLYIDGVRDSTSFNYTPSGSFTFNNEIIAAGNANNGSGPQAFFSGSMDDVRAYHRTLSQSEVIELYNTGVGSKQNITLPGKPNLSNGLVGWWTMDGKNVNWSSGKVTDSSGAGNHAFLNGFATSTGPAIGKLGQALGFNMATTFLSVPDNSSISFTLANSFSISEWIKIKSANIPVGCLDNLASKISLVTFVGFDINFIPPGGTGGCAFTHTNAIDVLFNGSIAQAEVETPTNSVPIGTWQHVVFTYNGNSNISGMKVYVNGVSQPLTLVSGTAAVSGTFANTTNLLMGDDGTDDYMNGSIDDTHIFNRALSQSEVNQLYLMGK